jgi:hypothetical protein
VDIQKLKDLIEQREKAETQVQKIDADIINMVNGAKKERKPLTCSVCGSEEHTARTCPTKKAPDQEP